ncbi:hypothetical protein JGH11_15685 [Dysgonomonas sp. Marseille-P4677]|uniref:hypothetical protein n=1 Tax=Dysgonomonas sp. Marseille-P4677 TaxID=2364790 RepID=UPI0019132E56|nr:hypothetical protein [Dysgonomonas sp. Marseille-P4677]MBK5722316.1 hypothetical protein [Dysgonomonas sp. Marseille-P4677]
MKKQISYLMMLFLIVFTSCSEENTIMEKPKNAQQEIFKVQGQPYDLSKSTIKRSNPVTRSSTKSGDPSFTMEGIKFWVGTGTKKAALVIEWHDGKNPDALVWGYKWNGDKYGIDMIRDIVNADPRLTFLTHMTGPMGYTIAGLGYDINKNGNHYLIYNNETNNPIYPVNGIVSTNAYNYDNWTYSDSADHWLSGWYNGYWSYFTKDTIDNVWEYSQWGASSRKLVDGSWDGWSFLNDMNEWEGKPLGNKFTAALPN